MFAAFATAMALTDGKSEPPLDGAEVDRLGNKPGASLMARSGERVVIADSREALACALAMAPEPSMRGIDRQLGRARVRVSAAGLTRSSRPDLHAVGEALLGLGCSTIAVDALVGPNGPLFIVRIPRVPAGPGAKLDPARLAEIPASASAAFSFPIDDRPESWDRLFAAIDRAERADPARRDRSPLRARIGLAARVGGIDLERDVWPKLRGATGFMVGPPRKPDGVALALHLVDDESAATFRDRVLPRFAKLLGLAPASGPGPNADSKPLADVAGRTVWVSTRFPKTVWIGWGAEGIPITFREGHPAKLVDPMEARDREQLKENHRFGWIIPGRFDLAPAGSPLAEAIAASGPIRWYGRDERTSTDDVLRWDGLDRGIRRYLELIPQEPAPASQK